jgi:hypothetical protein
MINLSLTILRPAAMAATMAATVLEGQTVHLQRNGREMMEMKKLAAVAAAARTILMKKALMIVLAVVAGAARTMLMKKALT